jgi:glycosyltransferase involved in cell wall biosynthesis
MNPMFSIVVPTLNQADFIGQTLASIAGQAWSNTEIIVIDGGSTDGTAGVVRRFGKAITHFISEPDRGQADAINKGMALARGDFLAWLNSDDYYLPDIFRRIAPLLENRDQRKVVHGGTIAWFEARNETRYWSTGVLSHEILKTRAAVYQPSSFWTRAVWEKTGGLNLDYHFVLDWDWFLRASAHSHFVHLDMPLSVYRFHAAHKTGSGNPRRAKEICAFVDQTAGGDWGAAFREVAERLDTLGPGLDRLTRLGLSRFRKWFYPGLYRRHGNKVKVALSQLRV